MVNVVSTPVQTCRAARDLTADLKDWKVSLRSDDNGWRTELVRENHISIAVYHRDERVNAVSLKPGQEATDYALLPLQAPWNVPVLALAYNDESVQPMLGLYNAKTGEQLRQLTGHSGPIHSLAFSAGTSRSAPG